ncbi:hypothetical protein [Kribbella sp. NPDC023855]|uniref:hypothetical protein n=1 Tax=Kribbella sp. NPDC023855 TaxID=3154698 RepID=UPI0034020ACD
MSVGFLTACSGGDYCNELNSYATAAKGLDVKDPKAVEKMRDEAKKVSKSAPDDLKDDWKILLDYADKAIDAKGDTAKLTELSKAEGAKVKPASDAIAKHAKDTCKLDLNG